jgi:hypothetical protein
MYVHIAFNMLSNRDMVLELNRRGNFEELIWDIREKLEDIIQADRLTADRSLTRLIKERLNSKRIADLPYLLRKEPKGEYDYDLAGEYEDAISAIKNAVKKEE